MIGTIYHISNCADTTYQTADFESFLRWAWCQVALQVDVETNVTDWWCTRELVAIQFGSCTSDRRQYFFQWELLTEAQRSQLKGLLESQMIQKIAHNAAYEYIILRFNGIICENLFCTMVVEKVLRGGLENENYALADISWKYLRIMMDKTLQKDFSVGMQVTHEHIKYGITDVAYLDVIKRAQILDAASKEVLNVIALECEALPAFCDITFEGMPLDKEKWRANELLAKPLVEEAHRKMNEWILQPPFKAYAIANGYLCTKDTCTINFNAPKQKTELLQLIFPDIAGAGLPVIKKYLRDNGPKLTTEQMTVLMGLQEKEYSHFYDYLCEYHREYLEAEGYLLPAGTVTINWGSQPQVLPLMQLVVPKLQGLAKEERDKHPHPILIDWAELGEAKKLISTYGEEFIHKHVGPDGRVRTRFNQVVSTGRVSSADPNMQNIPAKERVGMRYRNAFICDPGYCYVSSDFSSQELAIIAWISKDPVWLDVLEKGHDLHSVCAHLVHKKKWEAAAEIGCLYMSEKQKCKCKVHKRLRDQIKVVNFGLAYGMSEMKLMATLKITYQEAKALIEEYFRTFPRIGKTLDFLGRWGVEHGWIQTIAPFYRKRWFPNWEAHKPWIEAQVSGIRYIPALGEIERASKNQPIQGTGADMMKVAMVLVRSYIRDNQLRDRVRLAMQVHDQLDTMVLNEYAETWKPILDNLMCQAAKLIVPNGLLKADTTISAVWTK